jgi:ferredoxin
MQNDGCSEKEVAREVEWIDATFSVKDQPMEDVQLTNVICGREDVWQRRCVSCARLCRGNCHARARARPESESGWSFTSNWQLQLSIEVYRMNFLKCNPLQQRFIGRKFPKRQEIRNEANLHSLTLSSWQKPPRFVSTAVPLRSSNNSTMVGYDNCPDYAPAL